MMKHSLMAEMIGIYIFERRTELGISQVALSKRLECSAQFLGRIEKGYAMIPEAMLIKAITILKLDYSRCRKIYRICAEKGVEDLFNDANRFSTDQTVERNA